MAKQNGLGDAFFISGYDLSGDVNALGSVSGTVATLDVTAINKFAHERLGGLRDGSMDFTTVFDNAVASEHVVLSTLPRTDVIASYFITPVLGGAAASLNGKQIDYAPTRANDGMLTSAISIQGNAYGLEWGQQLTAGKRTDVAATLGTSVNDVAPSSFGFQAYLHVFSFAGTDATVKIQDSADNSTFADLASGAFTQITSTTPQAQRIAVGGTATVRQYVRVSTVTTGGFTSLAFAVSLTRNLTASEF
jgi:hypothetical protein